MAAGAHAADYRAEVGYERLRAELGVRLPRGTGVPVAQVEGTVTMEGKPAWAPEATNADFAGKTLVLKSRPAAGVSSGHATAVGQRFYGIPGSMAPGIGTIAAYGVDDWLGLGYLQTPGAGFLDEQPAVVLSRVANHSWVAAAPGFDSRVLRRVDWVVDRDEFVQVVGLPNAGSPMPLLSGAFNVIAVGRSDGQHATGTGPLDGVYRAGRARPDLVAPAENTSLATPTVAAAVALLVETGHGNRALSRDPVERSTRNRAGAEIMNAERSEVLRAVLLAGANRSPPAGLPGGYGRPEDRTSNGLDRRYGAGELDIYASWHILAAGEQDSREDGRGPITDRGFDYDPRFGGLDGSNERASYSLPARPGPAELVVALAWNLAVAGGRPDHFDGEATLYDLDLEVHDVTDPVRPVRVAVSDSPLDNTENLRVALEAGHAYEIRVLPGARQRPFRWDYALAWRVDPRRAAGR